MDYPWLLPVWQKLLSLFNQQRLPHALLLVGQKGVGKSYLAQRLAKLLLCQSPGEKACGRCRACYLAQAHPDYFCAEKGTGIEDVRAVIQFFTQSAHQDGKKVAILLNVDQMQPAATHALLKILEEPPQKRCFILTCEQITHLLPTLKSRCLILNVALQSEKALSWLGSIYPEKTASDLKWALAFSEGGPLNVKAILSSKMVDLWREPLYDLFFTEGGLVDDALEAFIIANLKVVLFLLYYWLVDCARSFFHCQSYFTYREVELKKQKAWLKRVAPQKIFAFLDRLNQAVKSLSLPGVNKLLLWEKILYQWRGLSEGKMMLGQL